MQSSGDLNVSGDIILKSELVIQSSGDINVGGKIYVIKGQGSINDKSSGKLTAKIAYVTNYRPASVAMVEKQPVVIEEASKVPAKKVIKTKYVPARNTAVSTGNNTIRVRQSAYSNQDVSVNGVNISQRQGSGVQDVNVGGIRVRQSPNGSIVQTPGATIINKGY